MPTLSKSDFKKIKKEKMKGDLKIMKQIILSNEEEANEELMWQPRTKATAATAGARGADCCAVTGVTLSKSTLELKVNDTHTLKETVKPSNATDSSVRWSSNKESVATVSASGLVCAKKAGTATITVETNDGGFTKTCKVTVKQPVTGVSISNTSLSLEVNGSYTLVATVAPSNATNPKVTWTSDNEAVATVSSSGLVCAKKEGTATITVKTSDGGYEASCEVTVKPATVKVTGIELEKTSLTMQVNDTEFLTACVKPSNATNQKIIWTSCSPDVVSVSNSGMVCAKQTGVVKITARTEDGGFSRTCVVTVTPNIVAVTGVRISHTTLELKANESRQLTANTLPSNTTNKRIDWTSSDESVATVRTSGLICAKKAGTTIITASCEEYSATCILTVIEGGVPVTGVELSQTSLSMEVDSSYLLQAEIFPSNATNKAVTWCSCSSDVATVSKKGLIQAKTTGSVKITATTEDGEFSETCWVTIVPKGTLEQVPVESVSITSQEETYHLVKMGETLSLNATVMPAAATNQEVVWLSEDASIATVDTNGVIHPRREGEVKIMATAVAGGKTAEYWVKVIPAVFVEDLLIDLAYKSGNTYQFAATTVPATATGALVWTSSDPSILSIDDNGVGTRLKDGAVTITATAKTTIRQVAQFEEEKNEGADDTDWGGAIGWFVLTFIVPFGFLLTLSGCSSEQGDTVTPTHTFETDDPYETPEETPGPTETPKPETLEPSKYVCITEDVAVNVRSSTTTSIETNKLLKVEPEIYIKYLSTEKGEDGQDWYKVQLFNEVEAYVRSDMGEIKLEGPSTAVFDEKGNILYYHCEDRKYLDEYRMMVNASYIYDNLISKGVEIKTADGSNTVIKWTPDAIYGLLGNVAKESRVNPDCWENGKNSPTGGYGLTQWTPKEKYTSWAIDNYGNVDAFLGNMDWQLDRIRYEVYWDSVDDDGGQWHSSEYGAGMSFCEYVQTEASEEISAEDLGEAFLRGYEKPKALIEGTEEKRQELITERRRLTKNWKEFFESNKLIAYKHEVNS